SFSSRPIMTANGKQGGDDMAMLPFLSQTVRVIRVPLEEIKPNPAQPRRLFEPEAIRGLADSIAQNGLLCPISLRKTSNGHYQLIAGERRLMAFRLLGETTIPSLVEQADDARAAALALVENTQRRDLNFYEESAAIAALIAAQGLTQRQAAERLGMAQPTLANKLRLLQLPEELLMRLVSSGLTERHARALLPLMSDLPRLASTVDRMIRECLTVSQTERLVGQTPRRSVKQGTRLLILKDLRIFTTTISRAVEIMKQAGIDTVTHQEESDDVITYTITISKTPVPHPLLTRPGGQAV
ncbi:MAG: ParB/RepB/Spo0J family partition protein, partial [Oscillospiraceae bacterium]